MAESSSASTSEQERDISDSNVVDRYHAAAEVANAALNLAASLCVPEASILEICAQVDAFIITESSKLFAKKKQMSRGIAFPTSISVNNCVGHFSPIEAASDRHLAIGDLVKVDLGVQIDDFPVTVAQTLVCGANEPVSGPVGDLLVAVQTAANAVLRMMLPGTMSTAIAPVVEKVAASFGCSAVEGVLTHRLSSKTIDGEKVIMMKSSIEHNAEPFEIGPSEVYALDIVLSTGDGKVRELSEKPMIFKKTGDGAVKFKASKALLAYIQKNHPYFCFNLRDYEDHGSRPMGVCEMLKNEVISPYPILYEREGNYVAQFKCTIFVTANGVNVITKSLPVQGVSEKSVTDPDLLDILSRSLGKKKKSKSKSNSANTSEN